MLRQTAVDMENSEQLLKSGDAETLIYKHRGRCMMKTCCLFISYLMFFGLGGYIGYYANNCDGSGLFFD